MVAIAGILGIVVTNIVNDSLKITGNNSISIFSTHCIDHLEWYRIRVLCQ